MNKEFIAELEKTNAIHFSGLEKIKNSKEDGSWFMYDDADALKIPPNLAKELENNFPSVSPDDAFALLSVSRRRMLLAQLILAKREETKQKRIEQILDELKAVNIKQDDLSKKRKR